MATGVDFFDQMRKAFGDPAENEKRRLRRVFWVCCVHWVTCVCWVDQFVRVEEVEDVVGVFFDPEFIVWPGGEGDVFFEVFDLEPVFNVDG